MPDTGPRVSKMIAFTASGRSDSISTTTTSSARVRRSAAGSMRLTVRAGTPLDFEPRSGGVRTVAKRETADLVVVGAGTVGGWASWFAATGGAEKVVVLERDLA